MVVMFTRAVSSRAISSAQLARLDSKRDLREEARLLVQRALAMRAARERSTGHEGPPTTPTPGKQGRVIRVYDAPQILPLRAEISS